MKRAIFILFFICFSSSMLLFAQKPSLSGTVKIGKIYRDFKKNNWLSYDVEKKVYTGDSLINVTYYSVIYNKKNNLYAQIGLGHVDIMANDENIKIIDRNKDRITCYNKHNRDTNVDMYSFAVSSLLTLKNRENIYSPYWYFENGTYVYDKSDITIDEFNYIVIKMKSSIYEQWNCEYTREKAEINNKLSQFRYDVSYFYNKDTKCVDRIEINTIDLKGGKSYLTDDKIVYKYSNISKENKQSVIDSVFNFKRKEYSSYQLCDDKTPIDTTSKNDSSMTDELLTYPLVNIYGDTTYIENINGWLYLDFWYYGCSVCFEGFENFIKEKQDYGQTFLEKNGIKILCINPYARDMLKLKNKAVTYSMEDYFYSGVDINKQINLSAFPTGFLVSPNKQIVYKHLGILKDKDYSEIFEIIKNYKK